MAPKTLAICAGRGRVCVSESVERVAPPSERMHRRGGARASTAAARDVPERRSAPRQQAPTSETPRLQRHAAETRCRRAPRARCGAPLAVVAAPWLASHVARARARRQQPRAPAVTQRRGEGLRSRAFDARDPSPARASRARRVEAAGRGRKFAPRHSGPARRSRRRSGARRARPYPRGLPPIRTMAVQTSRAAARGGHARTGLPVAQI